MELYALVRASSNEIVWGGFTTQEDAEEKAVAFAIVGGTMNLLSGEDLAAYLLKQAGVMWRTAG